MNAAAGPAYIRLSTVLLIAALTSFNLNTACAQEQQTLDSVAFALAAANVGHERCQFADMQSTIRSQLASMSLYKQQEFVRGQKGDALYRSWLRRLQQSVETDRENVCEEIAKTLQPFRDEAARTELGKRFSKARDMIFAGKFAEALDEGEKLLEMLKGIVGPDSREEAVLLNMRSIAYGELGDHQRAIQESRRAILIYERLGAQDTIEYTEALNNFAVMLQRDDQFPEAEAVIRRALAIYFAKGGDQTIAYLQSSMQLANVLAEQKKFPEAEVIYRRVIGTARRVLADENVLIGTTNMNLGHMLLDTSRFADAETALTDSIGSFEKSSDKTKLPVARTLVLLGRVYLNTKEISKANVALKRAVEILQQNYGPALPETAEALDLLARTIFTLGINTKGTNDWLSDYFQVRGKAVEAVLVNSENQTRNGPKAASVLLRNTTILDRYLVALGFLSNTPNTREILAAQGLNVVQLLSETGAALALEAVAERTSTPNPALSVLLRKKQDLAYSRSRLESSLTEALALRRDQKIIQERKRELDDNLRGQSETAAKIANLDSHYRDAPESQTLDVKEVQSLLSEDEAVVILHAGRDETSTASAISAWIITAKAFDWNTRFSEENQITIGQSIKRLRASLVPNGDVQKFSDLVAFDFAQSYQTYKLLFDGFERHLEGKKKLLIVPSGAITSLPFNVLVTEPPADDTSTPVAYRKAAWLIRKFSITILPSLGSLKTSKKLSNVASAKKSIVAFADPSFSDGIYPRQQDGVRATRAFNAYWNRGGVDQHALAAALPALPDTANEVDTVSRIVGRDTAKIFLGKDASETNVKGITLSDYKIVYFATHGLVVGDVLGLGEPALALAVPPSASSIDDGLLTTSEILQLRLNADWVVLSACNTAAGDSEDGDALSGLVRAFMYSGAKAILASHWPVYSFAAVRLTTTTFGAMAMAPGIGRAEALRTAMLGLLDDESRDFNAHPVVWAPFVYVGGQH